jgi:hypothetical protein
MGKFCLLWVISIVWTLGIGTYLVPKFQGWLRNTYLDAIKFKSYKPEEFGPIDWLLGFIERAFFMILIAFKISGAAVAMITWLLVKMATNWHRIIDTEKGKQPLNRGLALCSLVTGMVSLFFAVTGGIIWWWF